RGAVQLAVVALTETSVVVHRDPRAAERDRRRLDRPSEIGDVNDRDVAPALAELGCLLPAVLGEPPVEPARRDPVLVVDARRVRLVDDLARHQPMMNSTAINANTTPATAREATVRSQLQPLSVRTPITSRTIDHRAKAASNPRKTSSIAPWSE